MKNVGEHHFENTSTKTKSRRYNKKLEIDGLTKNDVQIKKVPQLEIVEEKDINRNRSGGAVWQVQNRDLFGIMLIIDEVEIKEKDFLKLVNSMRYDSFNIRIIEQFCPQNGKERKEVYIYFPSDMLNNHKVTIKYRDKANYMTQYVRKIANTLQETEDQTSINSPVNGKSKRKSQKPIATEEKTVV